MTQLYILIHMYYYFTWLKITFHFNVLKKGYFTAHTIHL